MSRMNVTLALARREDLPRLLEWRRQMWCADALQSANEARTRAETAMAHVIGDETAGRLWVVQSDGHAVGFIALVFSFSLEFGGRVAFIDELFVEEGSRGNGIGRRAVELVIDEARRLRVQNLMLEVNEFNSPARHIYECCGFTDRK